MTTDPGLTYLESGDKGVIVDRSTDRTRDTGTRSKPPLESGSQARSRRQLNTPTQPPVTRLRLRATDLRILADALTACTLTAHGEQLHADLDAADAVAADTPEPVDLATLHADLAAAVAAGKTTPLAAAKKYAAAVDTDAARPLAVDLAAAARRDLVHAAGHRLYDLGDNLITDIDRVVQAAAVTASVAGSTVEHITADVDIARAPADVHAAWSTLTDARLLIAACHRLGVKLRSLGLAPSLPPPVIPAVYWQWRNVDAVHATGTRGLHENHRLITLIEAGAQPAALTATELVKLYVVR